MGRRRAWLRIAHSPDPGVHPGRDNLTDFYLASNLHHRGLSPARLGTVSFRGSPNNLTHSHTPKSSQPIAALPCATPQFGGSGRVRAVPAPGSARLTVGLTVKTYIDTRAAECWSEGGGVTEGTGHEDLGIDTPCDHRGGAAKVCSRTNFLGSDSATSSPKKDRPHACMQSVQTLAQAQEGTRNAERHAC